MLRRAKKASLKRVLENTTAVTNITPASSNIPHYTGDQRQLIRSYREFMRLAQYIPKLKHQTVYKQYVKRQIQSPNEFLDKRGASLKQFDIMEPLSQEELIRYRVPKTLAFVQKAISSEKTDIHSTMFKNIIRFLESKKAFIVKTRKIDKRIDLFFDNYDYFDNVPEQAVRDEMVAIREMERLVMRFNESEGMCL